jgi:hypothetical protein
MDPDFIRIADQSMNHSSTDRRARKNIKMKQAIMVGKLVLKKLL